MSLYREGHVVTGDGLKLYYRDHDSAGSTATPVLCLAGLTRNTRDFEGIAAHLSAGRRVIAADMRGRGRSDYDSNFMSYAVPVETGDVLKLIETLALPPVVVLGTSRGGLLASVIAAIKPAVLKGVVLNDVGPEIDPRGIARIASYVGKAPSVTTWDDAVAATKAINGDMFDMDDAQWLAMTKAAYREEGGVPVLDYDLKIGDATRAQMAQPQAIDPWTVFGAFAAMPLLVLRGANSDLLSAATVAKMKAAKPDMQAAEIPGRGHAPLLDEPQSLAAIDAFLAGLDA